MSNETISFEDLTVCERSQTWAKNNYMLGMELLSALLNLPGLILLFLIFYQKKRIVVHNNLKVSDGA